MIDNRAVITEYEGHYVLMNIVGNDAQAIYVYDDPYKITEGAVINCRICENIANIDASFLRYDKDNTGFINRRIKCETVLPLQFKKEAYDNKKATFTDKITIDGDYVVVTYPAEHIKVSGKIEAAKKQALADAFREPCIKAGAGVVIRTKTGKEADGTEKGLLELKAILSMISSIKERSSHCPQYTVLYRPIPKIVRDILRLIDNGTKEIVTDIRQVYDMMRTDYDRFTGTVNPSDRVGLRFYEDPLIDLCHLYSFNAKISEALSHKVYLKSGGYITFDTTEALTAIDVNSASYDKGSDKEESFCSVNMEAARQIARQIRIRNIAGMIIIDFINMKSEDDYKKLENVIKEELTADDAHARFVDFTGLGLCEITRSRMGRSLYQSLRES